MICLILTSVVCGADSQSVNPNDWHPDTKILDATVKYGNPSMMDAVKSLTFDLKKFYQLLREKKWRETYELRAKAYREDVLESDYLAKAKKSEKYWGLINYDILSAKFENSYGGTNIDEAVLICKFIELPNYTVSYSTVFWHKEEGVWRCLSAGPSKLEIFESMRPPIIDWR